MEVPFLLPITLLLTMSTLVRSFAATTPDELVVEYGTYNITNRICFDKRILAGSYSPKVFNFDNPTNRPINYIKVEQDHGWRIGGIMADIIAGGLGTPSVTVQVTATQSRQFFVQNVKVEMMCSPEVTHNNHQYLDEFSDENSTSE